MRAILFSLSTWVTVYIYSELKALRIQLLDMFFCKIMAGSPAGTGHKNRVDACEMVVLAEGIECAVRITWDLVYVSVFLISHVPA